MITVIDADSIGRHRRLADSMFELRHSVFIDRLGWPLNSRNGREIDQFDRHDTVYLAVGNPRGQAIASCRLLPTIRPYLLKDIFPFLARDSRPPVHPLIWEASRLVVDHRKDRLAGCENVCGILLSGIMEYACLIGLTHLVSVSDARTERLLKRAGWDLNRLGEPHLFDGCRIVGEVTEVSSRALARIQTRYGISGSVLEVEEDNLKAA